MQTCIAVSQSGQHLAIGTGANASSGAQVIVCCHISLSHFLLMYLSAFVLNLICVSVYLWGVWQLMDASGSVIRAKRLHELAVTAVLFLDNDRYSVQCMHCMHDVSHTDVIRIASCGRDGKFNVLNFHTLAVERELLLQAPALCMTSYSGHIVIGLANGKIVVVHT